MCTQERWAAAAVAGWSLGCAGLGPAAAFRPQVLQCNGCVFNNASALLSSWGCCLCVHHPFMIDISTCHCGVVPCGCCDLLQKQKQSHILTEWHLVHKLPCYQQCTASHATTTWSYQYIQQICALQGFDSVCVCVSRLLLLLLLLPLHVCCRLVLPCSCALMDLKLKRRTC